MKKLERNWLVQPAMRIASKMRFLLYLPAKCYSSFSSDQVNRFSFGYSQIVFCCVGLWAFHFKQAWSCAISFFSIAKAFIIDVIHELCAPLPASEFNYRVLVLAEHTPYREIETLLRAIPIVCSKHATHFTLSVGPSFPLLSTQATRNLLASPQVEILTNHPTAELRKIVSSMDLCLVLAFDSASVPDKSDLLFRNIQEAYEQQKAIVVSKSLELPDFVIDGETALIVSQNDSFDWADAMNRLLPHPYKRDHMGAMGKMRLHSQVNSGAVLESIGVTNELAFRS